MWKKLPNWIKYIISFLILSSLIFLIYLIFYNQIVIMILVAIVVLIAAIVGLVEGVTWIKSILDNIFDEDCD